MSNLDPSQYRTPPPDYETPEWPALYLPWLEPSILYQPSDIWRFTMIWVMVMHTAVFGITALWAVGVFSRRRKRQLPFVIGIPFAIVAYQAIIAFVSGTVVGFALAAIYVAAYLRMSTWVPFLWALALTLVVVVSSYTSVTVLL